MSRVHARAGKSLKNLRIFDRFLGVLGFYWFLGFNVRTVSRGTMDTRIGLPPTIKKKAIGLHEE